MSRDSRSPKCPWSFSFSLPLKSKPNCRVAFCSQSLHNGIWLRHHRLAQIDKIWSKSSVSRTYRYDSDLKPIVLIADSHPDLTWISSNCTNSAHRTCTVAECQENYMIIVVRLCEDDSSSHFAAKGLSMRINLTQQQRPTAFHLPRCVVALSGAQRLVHCLRPSVLLTLNAMAC